jgi:hypothetical protein
MTPQKQTIFGSPNGNCFATCVASLLDLPLSEVPNFCGGENENWFSEFQQWLGERGFYAIDLHAVSEPFLCPVPDGTLVIISGMGARGLLHSIIGSYRLKDGEHFWDHVHDPHPDDTGIEDVRSITFIVRKELI